MFSGNITLRGQQLKQIIVEGLAVVAGVTTTSAEKVQLSYDKGGGTCMDSGSGVTAAISATLAGQSVTINKSEAELKELVKAAMAFRGFTVNSTGVGLYHSSGDRAGDSGDIYAHVFVDLPERLPLS